ncbi:hypothetical protein KY284_000950 [Solanum tuberosum]|nr:hypothetical protein KY284_000950 [Solanum tuberosum]
MNDGSDHTGTNSSDPIITTKLSVLGRENDIVRTCDGRSYASMRVEARSVGGRLRRWEEIDVY